MVFDVWVDSSVMVMRLVYASLEQQFTWVLLR
jgi:hypothetical protein